eukprot:scaffold75286_cov17-Tisochrysis_lutea.AAC.2
MSSSVQWHYICQGWTESTSLTDKLEMAEYVVPSPALFRASSSSIDSACSPTAPFGVPCMLSAAVVAGATAIADANRDGASLSWGLPAA